MKNILITGGAGFIGSHLVRLMVNKYPAYRIINLDKLTYAGNLANLKDIEKKPNYVFEKADICDFPAIQAIFEKYQKAFSYRYFICAGYSGSGGRRLPVHSRPPASPAHRQPEARRLTPLSVSRM